MDIILRCFFIKQDAPYANFPWIFQYHLQKEQKYDPCQKNKNPQNKKNQKPPPPQPWGCHILQCFFKLHMREVKSLQGE